MVNTGGVVINRTQALVLGFFLLVWVAVIAILVVAPGVYEQTLRQAPGSAGTAEIVFVAALSGLIAVLFVGVLRRWRWAFWLILIAFFGGALRVPAAALQMLGYLSPADPTWYVIVQGVVGAIQVAIALAMLAGYRRAGIWGAF
ncbi:MAG TPA: hypothetical protein VIV12_06530 [Streptosporangiaceae bacterium]